MTQKFDEIKKDLLIRKKELEEALKELANEGGPDTDVKDLGDQVSASTLESLRQSLENAEFQEYQGILKALKAIDNGTYGVCIDCGDAIPTQRLQVFPDASRCISCQEALER